MKSRDLLVRMQSSRIHMALVIDEYGGTDGLVTIEDLINENIISPEERRLAKQALVEIKYEGYLRQQRKAIEKVATIEGRPIPSNIDYKKILGLKTESREKLIKFAPKTLYDAKKIGGINPADIMILVTYLEKTGIKERVK